MSLDEVRNGRAIWIAAFTEYVFRVQPRAVPSLVAESAAELQARLSEFDPVDVAEATWEDLQIDDLND